jgi:hypothetical protein
MNYIVLLMVQCREVMLTGSKQHMLMLKQNAQIKHRLFSFLCKKCREFYFHLKCYMFST